jgi:hypothetical protein
MASRRDIRKPKKIRSSRPDDTSGSIFSDKVSNVIPGELIVQLSEELAGHVSASIAQGPMRGIQNGGPSVFGVDAVDSILSDLKAISISRLHPAAPVASQGCSRTDGKYIPREV